MKKLIIILVSLLITGLYCVVVSIIPLVILFDIFFPNNNFFSFCLLCIVGFMTICIPFLGVYVIDKISLQKDEKEKPEDKKSQK